MPIRAKTTALLLILLSHGCSSGVLNPPSPPRYKASGGSPEKIALYEAWFGHPHHISVGYSSHDGKTIASQMRKAKEMGISAFVVDWYGDREPFIDSSYALMENIAENSHFKIAMMYDETDADDGATDEAIADFTMFHEIYLSPSSPGRKAYLTFEGRPVIFIFPKGKHTDWSKVHALVSQWNPVPFLVEENLPGSDAASFDGFYAWINPGNLGWAADGSHWGEQYLDEFYRTMRSKYPDKMIVGGAWATFDDSKASWGLNRHISARCGQTFADTSNYWRRDMPASDAPPFLMIETWNDYEEGTAIEPGIPTCGDRAAERSSNGTAEKTAAATPSGSAQ